MIGAEVARTDLNPDWVSLVVSGEIDLATVDGINDAIQDALDNSSSHVLVDLTQTSFMDSTGLRALVRAHRSCEMQGRKFALLISPGPISRLFDLSGLDSALNVLDTIEGLDTLS